MPKAMTRFSAWMERLYRGFVAHLPDDVRGVILICLFIALVFGIVVILLPTSGKLAPMIQTDFQLK